MSEEKMKRYWKTLEEKDAEGAGLAADGGEEFPLGFLESKGVARRDFLKVAGFAMAAGAAATGCRLPVRKAIPYLVPVEEVVPGRAYHYATTCGACAAGCGVIVKNRDGRPIKLEGNPLHPVSMGGLCAAGQASVLGLYDSKRLRGPMDGGAAADWGEVDADIASRLAELRKSNGAVRVLTGALHGPAELAAVTAFVNSFKDGRHDMFEPLSASAVAEAHALTHDVKAVPRYAFDRAKVVVSFGADFLGTWISPVEFAAGYAKGRHVAEKRPEMSWHAQFEGVMTLAGSNADVRHRVRPWEMGLVMSHVADRMAAMAGKPRAGGGLAPSPVAAAAIEEAAEKLMGARGRGLVVCGAQDTRLQVLCNYMNELCGAYGSTVDIVSPSYQRSAGDAGVAKLLEEIRAGKVKALFVAGVNPLYSLPGAAELEKAIKEIPLTVSLSMRMDETASACKYVCPDSHYLESWGDSEPAAGVVAVRQPVIEKLFGTRPAVESFAKWAGRPEKAYDLVRRVWRDDVFPMQSKYPSFTAFWDAAVHDGAAAVKRPGTAPGAFDYTAVKFVPDAKPPAGGAMALTLYAKVGMGDGRHAYNPWLHELPDPISKITWDNYANFSPEDAARLGIKDDDVVKIETPAGAAVEAAAHVQAGQAEGVVSLALGYGARETERFAKVGPQWLESKPTTGENNRVGVNAAALAEVSDGLLISEIANVKVAKTGRVHELAATQHHNTLTVPKKLQLPGLEGKRPIVQEATLDEFAKNPHAGAPHTEGEHFPELWPDDHKYTGMRWGMVIDLAKCNGCSACVTACQVENNIPVVGRDEVRRSREMHWLRLDRYYSGDGGDVDVVFQPMFCQQCAHAPCETVCPALATVHSSEGLNQQVYNRCVGTRYCANNCPYKVRRFNWFNYPHEDKLANMSLNPDVTVRMRGIMEKCTFCVQRIQEAKMEAKRKGAGKPADGDIKPACMQSCPAGAIAFGDLNDPKSEVSRLMASHRRYRVLEEINVQPSVGYLRVIRNRKSGGGGEGHGV